MPAALTYPGVYIEEVPSGVRTLTGVSTSIAAFIGYTARGSVNQALRVLSFADYQRTFGPLAMNSPVSHAVDHFFRNGGADAYVVRVAHGAAAAGTTLLRSDGGAAALQVDALSEGTWGNRLRVSVDYDTPNPASLFNLSVIEFTDQDGQLVAGAPEEFRNLSMNSSASRYAVRIVNDRSALVRLTRVGPPSGTQATSTTRTLTAAGVASLLGRSSGRIAYSLDGNTPVEIDVLSLGPLFATTDPFETRLAYMAQRVVDVVNAIEGINVLGFDTVDAADTSITFRTTAAGESASIAFSNAGSDNVAGLFGLGLANGGRETEGATSTRPAQSGTTGLPLGAATDTFTPAPGPAPAGTIQVQVMRGTSPDALDNVDLALWGTGSGSPPVAMPTTVQGVLDALSAAVHRSERLAGCSVALIDGSLRLQTAVGVEPNTWLRVADAVAGDTTAAAINLSETQAAENLAWYAPGSGAPTLAQGAVLPGNDGAPPTPAEFRGSEAAKTGLYALENVDLFNMLCLPDVEDIGVLGESLAYCERRRAMLIIDPPPPVDTLARAQAWLTANASLRSRNAAAYFPRLQCVDSQLGGVVRDFPPSGAVAGLYARTDTERGVWKAPAGISAVLLGAVGPTVSLTDREHGVLNPLGLNVIRSFPVVGTVAWGARTLRGADILADEYKYVPVRRLALFLEESLYRGTQWVVFEPNDEPLWAQIRLNISAFMHSLFYRGAFQGGTPRQAYFVRCDKDTTSQNDIDLGRVNIVVGFAPLKPAEFVVIQIQQIAGALRT